MKIPASRHTPTRRVGLLVDTSTSWGRRILAGVQAYNRKNQSWHLWVEARGQKERLRLPDGWQGDGVIARVADGGLAKHLAARKFPVVNVSGIELPGKPFPCVTTDLAASARLAVDHFTERGFRDLAYYNPRRLSYIATHRAAFASAAKQAGCMCHTHISSSPNESPRSARKTSLSRWLKSLPKPVGILVWNIGEAWEILLACEQEDILVPEEISLLSGSDDDLLCELTPVPVSASG